MTYLLSASVAMAIFYALYALTFRRLPFHGLNRVYLLAALGLSLIIPLVELPAPTAPVASLTPERFFAATIPANMPLREFAVQTEVPKRILDWQQISWVVYLLGVAAMALHLTLGLGRLTKLARRPGRWEGGLKIIPTSGPNASFFNLIFLNETGLIAAERAQVLAHEAEHARLGHSADRLLLEVLRVAFWFNPVVWLYQRSLAHLHELQVDERVTRRFDARAYADLLLRLYCGADLAVPAINLFSRQPLKDRLVALFQTKPTSTMKKLLYLTAAPVALTVTLALASVSTSTPSAQTTPVALTRAIGDEPAGHLELKYGRATAYLNLNRYDPAFIETAKRFFQSNGVELTVSEVRIDAFGKFLSGRIELIQKSGGSASIQAAEEDAKTDGSRWVYLVVNQRSGDVGAGSLPKGFMPAVNALQTYLPHFLLPGKNDGC